MWQREGYTKFLCVSPSIDVLMCLFGSFPGMPGSFPESFRGIRGLRRLPGGLRTPPRKSQKLPETSASGNFRGASWSMLPFQRPYEHKRFLHGLKRETTRRFLATFGVVGPEWAHRPVKVKTFSTLAVLWHARSAWKRNDVFTHPEDPVKSAFGTRRANLCNFPGCWLQFRAWHIWFIGNLCDGPQVQTAACLCDMMFR